MNENGSYVTRAELSAHLTPIRQDIGEIKDGVQALLLDQAGREAIRKSKRKVSDRVLAYTAIIGALVAPLAWSVAAHL